MSIGSIIEPTMRHDYAPSAIHSFADFSHLPVPAAPRMPSELMYGMSVSDSPYPSSDSSSYSPISELIQPQIPTHPFHPPDDLPGAVSAPLECTFPQQLYTSPLTTTSPISSWDFDQPPLSAPMHGSMQASMLPTVRDTICSCFVKLADFVCRAGALTTKSLACPHSWMQTGCRTK